MATRFAMQDRRRWINYVLHRFDVYWQLKLPVPVDPIRDIYRGAFTDKQWAAMRYIKQEMPKMLMTSRTFDLYWTDDDSCTSTCPHVQFTFPNKRYLPDMSISLKMLRPSVQDELRSWITSVNHYRSLRSELRRRCIAVMGHPMHRFQKDLEPCVNTAPQLYRLWPECQPVMLPDWKSEIRQAHVRSPLPKRIAYQIKRDHGTVVEATPEQFRGEDPAASDIEKKRFKEINDILTMISLASTPPDDSYPTFYGNLDFTD